MTAAAAMYRHRYGGSPPATGGSPPVTGDLLAAFHRPAVPPRRSAAIAPGTPRSSSSPVTRFAHFVEPFCLHPPQVSGNTVYVVVEGPFWTAVAVAASEISDEAGTGLQIQVGVGDKISLAEGTTTASSFTFLDAGR